MENFPCFYKLLQGSTFEISISPVKGFQMEENIFSNVSKVARATEPKSGLNTG